MPWHIRAIAALSRVKMPPNRSATRERVYLSCQHCIVILILIMCVCHLILKDYLLTFHRHSRWLASLLSPILVEGMGQMTLKFELGLDFLTMHLPTNFILYLNRSCPVDEQTNRESTENVHLTPHWWKTNIVSGYAVVTRLKVSY